MSHVTAMLVLTTRGLCHFNKRYGGGGSVVVGVWVEVESVNIESCDKGVTQPKSHERKSREDFKNVH